MKKISKILAVLMAAVMALTALCVTASAADKKVSLLSFDLHKIDKLAEHIYYIGQDLYVAWGDKERAIYRIDSTALENWRKTGKLKASKVKIISDMTDHLWDVENGYSFLSSNYLLCDYYDSNDVDHSFVLKYNKKKNTLTQVYASTNSIGVTKDGYISDIEYNEDKNIVTVKIISPKGKQLKKLTYDINGKVAWWNAFQNNSPYTVISFVDDNSTELKNGNVVLIDKKGKTKTLKNIYMTDKIVFEDGFYYMEKTDAEYDPVIYTKYYSFSENKSYSFADQSVLAYTYNSDPDTKHYFYIDNVKPGKYGNTAIVHFKEITGGDDAEFYCLMDIKNSKLGKYDYDYLDTLDNGKSFLMRSGNSWYFTDADENFPDDSDAAFEDADAFFDNALYAPVIKDGKIYLVDRSLKQVSNTIKAKESYVYSLSEEVFCYTKSGKVYVATYKK